MPVVPIAKILRMKLEWNKTESTLKSKFGKVICYERKDQLYCNADDAMILFNIEGGLQTNSDGGKIFRFKSMPITKPLVKKPKDDKKIDKAADKKSEPKPEDDVPKLDVPEDKSQVAEESPTAEKISGEANS